MDYEVDRLISGPVGRSICLEAVQRCKSERSSCAKVQRFFGLEPELGLGLENFSGLRSQPPGLGHWSLDM